MISTRSLELVIDTVVCLTLAKWETVSGQFGGYLTEPFWDFIWTFMLVKLDFTTGPFCLHRSSLGASFFGSYLHHRRLQIYTLNVPTGTLPSPLTQSSPAAPP